MSNNDIEQIRALVRSKLVEIDREISKLEADTNIDSRRQTLHLRELRLKVENELDTLQPQTDIEGVPKTLTDLVDYLQLPDVRKAEDRRNALCKLAAEVQLKEWSEPHDYGDGDIDLPILSAETLEDYGEAEA